APAVSVRIPDQNEAPFKPKPVPKPVAPKAEPPPLEKKPEAAPPAETKGPAPASPPVVAKPTPPEPAAPKPAPVAQAGPSAGAPRGCACRNRVRVPGRRLSRSEGRHREAEGGEADLLHRGGEGQPDARARRPVHEQGSGGEGARAPQGARPRAGQRGHQVRM